MFFLPILAVALAGVGTAVSVYGQVQQAQTAKAMGKYNAKLAEQQAQQTELDAAENIRRKRRENKRLLATQRSRYAKAGVLEEGTPLELLAETAGNLEMETLDYDRQQRQAAAGLRAQGAADLAMGANQARGALIGAGASLLQGAASTAYMGSTLRGSGALSGGGGSGQFVAARPISGTSASLL